jgi:hypothetical protein
MTGTGRAATSLPDASAFTHATRLLDWLDRGIDRIAFAPHAPALFVASLALINAVCVLIGLATWGQDGVHQLFRDLGPASFVTAALTLVCALFGALIARREATHHGHDWRDFTNYWFLAAIGFLYLSIDAPLDIHGKLGNAVERHAGVPPFINHWSDFVLVFYMAAGLLISALHWRELASHRRALALFLAGAAISAVMLLVDSSTAQRPWQQVLEESLELFAGALLVFAFRERFASTRHLASRATSGESA